MIGHQGMFRKGWAESDALAAHEIPRDPTLPQLAVILDPLTMHGILQGALSLGNAEQSLKITCCRIVNVSFRPGRECQVTYALDMAGSHGGGATQFVTAKAMTEKRAQRVLAKRLTVARDQGVVFANLPDHQMVVTRFPNDLRVHTLHRLVDSDEFQRRVLATLGKRAACGERTEEETMQLSIVSYRPERSCLLRCVLSGGAKQPRLVFARVYRDHRVVQVYEAMTALWDGNARRAGRLSVAESLGYDLTARILFQGPVDGVPLVDLIGKADFLEYVAMSARSLAAIHQNEVHLDRARSLADEMEWIALIGRGFAKVLPEAGERLQRILEQLRQSELRLPIQQPRMIHGDFSLSQVLATAGHVSVIDFDDACMGDPYADLGTFLARLDNRVKEPTLRTRAGEVFKRQYENAARVTLSTDRIAWHQATSFLRLALTSLARLRPGWLHRVDENLNRAQQLIIKGSTT